MADPILELTTAKEKRRKVRIDGELYEILSMSELGLAQMLSFIGKDSPLAALAGGGENALEVIGKLGENQLDQLAGTVHKMAVAALQAPGEVIDALSDMQKLSLIQAVFTMPVVEVKPSAKKKSSRASKGSTAARRKTG